MTKRMRRMLWATLGVVTIFADEKTAATFRFSTTASPLNAYSKP